MLTLHVYPPGLWKQLLVLVKCNGKKLQSLSRGVVITGWRRSRNPSVSAKDYVCVAIAGHPNCPASAFDKGCVAFALWYIVRVNVLGCHKPGCGRLQSRLKVWMLQSRILTNLPNALQNNNCRLQLPAVSCSGFGSKLECLGWNLVALNGKVGNKLLNCKTSLLPLAIPGSCLNSLRMWSYKSQRLTAMKM